MRTTLAATNLALKFLLELGAIALLATWGVNAVSGWSGILLGLGVAAATILVWGRYAAPQAPNRLGMPLRAVVEVGIFTLAALAGFAAGLGVWATAYAVLVAINAVLLTVFGQWEA